MLRNIAPLLALLLCVSASKVSAQEFDNFRLLGENTPAGAGFVTSVSLDTESDSAQISYLNVAGLSKVYDVNLKPSEIIRSGVPVFMPPPGFSDFNPPALNLEGVGFFTGDLIDPDDGALPPHWFRLTKYDDRWSGVFRIADRIYAIDRNADNNVINVRHTPSLHDVFQPAKRVKISAVIDEQYLFGEIINDLGHIYALESIHVMDGLLADSLGLTVLLEQVIYQPSDSLSSPTQLFDLNAGARNWLGSNSQAFGLTDNLATLFFRKAASTNTDQTKHPDDGLVDDDMIILQGNNTDYQFATAHYFGKLLGIFEEPKTLQDWATDGEVALSAVHWTDRQKEFLDFNPPAADLTQLLSYDAPEIATPVPEKINVVDAQLVGAESPEGNSQQPGLFNDGESTTTNNTSAADSGGGAISADLTVFLLILIWLSAFKNHGCREAIPGVTRQSA